MSSGTDAIEVCASAALVDGGHGVRFPVVTADGPASGFVIRYRGQVRGYLNRCTHAYAELDWQRNRFLDRSGLYLMCAVHGATYAPDTGQCTGGPCRGQALRVIAVEERDGTIYWFPDERVAAVEALPP